MMMMLRLLLRLLILLCLGGTTTTTVDALTFVNDINDPSSKTLILQDISLLLASFDVTGLCHPTSNQHAPIFPKCGGSGNGDGTTTTATEAAVQQQQAIRLLEDEGYRDDDNNSEEEEQEDEEEQEEEEEEEQDKEDEEDEDERGNNYQDRDYYYQYMMDDDEANRRDGWSNRQKYYEEELEDANITKWYYVVHASLTIICVIVGALASGLYVGMLSLDPLVLVIKSRTAKKESERKRLDRLLATIKQRHQLIVTLLIVNCVAAEAMPIFLQHFVHDGVAIIASVVLVLIFGEILPALIFTGSDQVEVACRLAPIVRLLMCLLYPLAYPVAYLLEVLSSGGGVDNATGTGGDDVRHHRVGGTVYSRGELAALIRVQYEERRALRQQRKAAAAAAASATPATASTASAASASASQSALGLSSLNDILDNSSKLVSPTSSIDLRNHKRENIHASLMSIDSHDVNMLEGALQLRTKTALDIYLSHHKVFCIPHDMELDESNIFTIYASGYSRVPVFVDGDRRKVKGILMTRQLMVVNKGSSGDEKYPTPASLSLHTPRCVAPDTNLVELINLFQSGGRSSKTRQRPGHMALVCARPQIGNAALERGVALPEKAGLMGIITLEDVLEALLQDQIYDEMDGPGSDEDPEAATSQGRLSIRAVDEMATIQESNSYHQMPS